MPKGKFKVDEEDVGGLIDILQRTHRNPAEDAIIQVMENAIDAVDEARDEGKIFTPHIEVYPTMIHGLCSIVIEDNGIGMDARRAEKYANIAHSVKKLLENKNLLGYQGAGRLSYIRVARSGTFVDTHYFDGSHKEMIYAMLFGKLHECSFRSACPDHEAWPHYDAWTKEHHKEMREGSRIVLWNVEKEIYDEILKSGERWIARKFSNRLDEIQIYFNDIRVFQKPPKYKWSNAIGKNASEIKIGGKLIQGEIGLCERELDGDAGIGIRALNRTIKYTDFGLVGRELMKRRISGWIDVHELIGKDMVTPAKDDFIDGPIIREIWSKMRSFEEERCLEWTAREEQSRFTKTRNAFRSIARYIMKTFGELSIKPKTDSSDPSEEEVGPYHHEGDDKEDRPIIRDGRKMCSCCMQPLDPDPDRTGRIGTLDYLKTVCPCPNCGHIPYKKHIHKSAIGKKYKLYICKKCGHHLMEIVVTTQRGVGLDFPDEWKHDKNLEFVYMGGKLDINKSHPSFISAFKESRKSMRHKSFEKISEKDVEGTPLEFHVVNCAAIAYVQNINEKQMDRDTIPGDVATFKAKYFENRNAGRKG